LLPIRGDHISHYITVPTNANGIIFDADMNGVVAEAVALDPFNFGDVFVYSHGWSTNAARALDEYNRFSVDLAKRILIYGRNKPTVFSDPPQDSLGVGIHWPSEITEDPSSPLNVAQLFTFYTMEHRADAVGKNAVYSMLRLMLNARCGTGKPLRIFLLGHSFGCKVVCAALEDLQGDIAGGTVQLEAGTTFAAVLLEAATANDNLEPGDIYGRLVDLPLRILTTQSSRDKALTEWFVAAGKLANLFKTPRQALGAQGPTQKTLDAFGGANALSIQTGFTAADAKGHVSQRLVVADLTPVHTERATQHLYDGGASGSHSDINFAEVYELVCAFLYRVT
jgi:hypothetical protein